MDLRFEVWGLEFGVWGLGFGVWGLGSGDWGLGFGVWGLGGGDWGLGSGVWDLGFGVTSSLARSDGPLRWMHLPREQIGVYRGTSLIRNTQTPRITVGP